MHDELPVPPAVSTLATIEAHAARAPGAPAVVSARARLTYEELNRRANRLARRLRALGVGREVIVAIHCERSAELVVGVLAILKAGGAYVPLDPAYPVERNEFLLADSGARVLLTRDHPASRLRAPATILSLDTEGEASVGEDESSLGFSASPGDLAYVIYTSGSTGRPKGVAVEHRSFDNLVAWHLRTSQLGPDDRTTQIAGVAFDASVWEIWPSLAAGACLYIPDDETRAVPTRLLRWLAEQAITSCFLPTPLAEAVLREPRPEGLRLRALHTGGETLHLRPPAETRYLVVNLYGPAECTVVTTSMIVTADGEGPPPIGRPIDGAWIHLLDDALRPVPEGAPGELYIAGAGLARGYLNRPDLTADRFLPDPFGAPGARMYRTGDLARRSPDGTIEFLGRIDDQVKIRGFRIELQEIEAVLREHPAVREAVVLVREDRPGDKRLSAYVVADAALVVADLRAFAARKLPAYMVPWAFVEMTALPITPNGKVDRRALPPPEAIRDEAPAARPLGAIEERIAAIWSEVLGVPAIGRGDEFFALGGHSIYGAQVITRVQRELHVDVPLRALFDAPTLARFAAVVAAEAANERREQAAIVPASRDGRLPLSFSQERVWFLHRMHADNLAYSFQATLRLRGDLRAGVLERSFTEIIRRHEMFRTTFPSIDGQPYQRIHEPWPVEIPLFDLSSSAGDREAEAREHVAREVRRPFDLEALPLIRWSLIRLSRDEHLLVHVEHHLVHDGWSWNLFLGELEQLYGAFSRGEPSPLPEPSIQFADYACHQRRWMEGGEARAQLAFWRETLAGSPPTLDLAGARPRPRVQTFRGASLRVELPRDLHRALRALGDREGASVFMTMLAAFLAVLRRASGRDDLCIGSAVANRGIRDAEGLIGMIVNTVAIRADLAGDPTFRELLRRVRHTCLDAYANQDVPFDKVVEAVRPERSLAYSPIYQILFSFHDTPMPEMALPGLVTSVTEGLSNGSAKFDLNVIGIPRAEARSASGAREAGITMVWEYNADLFDREAVEALYAEFEAWLRAAVADPERRLGGAAGERSAAPREVKPRVEAQSRMREAAAPVSPRTPEEATIAAIWADVLGLPSVGVHDDFFALGGHSLMASRIVARVERAFGVPVSLLVFFEQLDVARLTEAVVAARAENAAPAIDPLRVDSTDPSWLLAHLDELSEEHVDTLLREMGAQGAPLA